MDEEIERLRAEIARLETRCTRYRNLAAERLNLLERYGIVPEDVDRLIDGRYS